MNKEKPLVAIVIPVYNSGIFLKKTLDAIYDSTKFPFKVILVENESTDGTDILCNQFRREYNNLEVYHLPTKGMIPAINYGIKKAGELDVYLTQDDVIHFKLLGRDWLAEMYKAAKNKEIGQITSISGLGISGEEYFKGFIWVGTWSCYIPRRVINKVGLFDENMLMGVDIDYSFRVRKVGFTIKRANFWVQHHGMTEPRSHQIDSSKQAKEGGIYFRKKYNLGEK